MRVSTREGVAAYHRPSWPRRTRCKEGNLAFFYDTWGSRRAVLHGPGRGACTPAHHVPFGAVQPDDVLIPIVAIVTRTPFVRLSLDDFYAHFGPPILVLLATVVWLRHLGWLRPSLR